MSLQQDPLQFTSITSVVWITGGSDFRSIAAGARQTCGPTSAGIQCWDFVGGQTSLGWDFGCAIETGGGSFLGSGFVSASPGWTFQPQTVVTRSCSPLVWWCINSPASLQGVTAGSRHACALDPNGSAFC